MLPMTANTRIDLLYTTGQCAEKLQVSEAKVRRYIDDQILEGMVLPRSTHRRVRATELRRFMIEYGFMKDPKAPKEGKTKKGT